MRGLREWLFYLSVGVGMALGTSVFTMLSGLFQVAALPWVMLGIALAALFCVAIALSIGELASMWPSAPAIRTYFKMAFGARPALALVYLYIAFIVLVAGVESYMFALVVRALFPALAAPWIVGGLLAGVILFNVLGLELPRALQMLTAFLAVAIILAAAALGVLAAGPAEIAAAAPGPPATGLAALPAVVGLAVFLFMGFEWVTPVGLRPEAYARRIPWSMPAAIAVLLIAYLAFAFGIARTLPREAIAAESVPQVRYFLGLLGPGGLYLAGFLSLLAIFSTFNAGVMGGARLIHAMAREGVLPRACAAINPATGAPLGAVLLLGGLALLSSFVVVGAEAQLLAAVTGAAIICFVYAAYLLAVLRLRRTRPEHKRPFRNRLPRPVQWAVCALLPPVGAATLVSLPELGAAPLALLATCAALAAALAEWSQRRVQAVPSRSLGHAVPRAAARREPGA